MLTYGQLLNLKGSTRKRFWYIYGTDSALIQDAIELAKDHVSSGVSSVFTQVFFGSNNVHTEISFFIDIPYFDERKLAIVYESEKIKDWTSISAALENADSSTFIIFVSGDVPSHEEGAKNLFTNNKLGRIVRCEKLDEKTVKKWIRSRLTISDTAINNLLSKYNNDNEWLLNKIRILEHLDVPEITPTIVERICTDSGVDSFEDSLLRFDKQQCFLYIKDRELEKINIHKIINETHNLALLQTAMGQYSRQIRPLEDKTGLSRKQIEGYMDRLSYYDLTASTRCFKALTKLHSGLQKSDKFAYLALVCRW